MWQNHLQRFKAKKSKLAIVSKLFIYSGGHLKNTFLHSDSHNFLNQIKNIHKNLETLKYFFEIKNIPRNSVTEFGSMNIFWILTKTVLEL